MNAANPRILEESDLALLSALQTAPRAPWTAIGQVVGIDSSTAARRWRRLEESRLAWFVAHHSPGHLAPTVDAAVVDFTAPPAARVATLEHLAARPEVLNADLLAGDHDGSIVVVGHGLASAAERVDQLLADAPSVDRVRRRFIVRIFAEDTQWRLPVLSRSQRRVIATPGTDHVPSPPRAAVIDDLVTALQHDARMSLAHLAGRLGVSEVTARRQLDRALRSDAIRLGCDFVVSSVGIGRAVRLDLASQEPEKAGTSVAAQPATARCLEVVGDGNILAEVRMPSLTRLSQIESAIHAATGAHTLRRHTVLRAFKRYGRRVCEDGRLAPEEKVSSSR